MELGQNMPAAPHGVDQLVGQVLGVAGHEADAGNVHAVQAAQQFREGGSALQPLAVGIHILSQQHDFLHAAYAQLLRFPEDIVHPAAALPPADIGHDAVGAEVVAAVHNGDVRRILPQPLDGQILGNGVLVLHFHHGPVAVEGFAKQFRQAVQVGGSEGQIHKAVLLQDLFCHAGLLNHAAAHADDEAGVALAYFLQPGHIAQGTALGVVADAAGVEQHKIGMLPVGGLLHAHVPQHARENLAVMGVHLAAVGYHKIAPGALGQSANLAHKLPLLLQLFVRHLHRLSVSHGLPPRIAFHVPTLRMRGRGASIRPAAGRGFSFLSFQSGPGRSCRAPPS